MENDYKDNTGNVYLRCRKRAAQCNEALSSREKAAELLGISSSSLANYELGITKTVPVDMVVMMATESKGLESITLKILKSLDEDEIKAMKKSLVDIAEDGEITEDEQTRGQTDSIIRRALWISSR